MTETQAKSGAAGASTNPVDEDAADGGGASATGRAAVGRAAVTGDAPSPKFTRAPGMAPPPERPADQDDPSGDPSGDPAAKSPASGGTAVGSAPATSTAAGSATATGTASPTGAGRTPAASPGTTPPSVTGTAAPVMGSQASPVADGRASQAGGGGIRAGQSVDPERTTPLPTGARATAPRPGQPGKPGGLDRASDRTAGPEPTRPIGTGRFAASDAPRAPTGGAAAVGAARVTEAVRAARSTVSSAASRGPRRARLNLKRIDPWSVMKFSFAVSLVLFVVVIVATSVLYLALDAMGVFDSVNGTLTDMVGAGGGGQGGDTFKITAKGVIFTSALIGAINVVLFTALATLGAFVYNVCADLVGGIELTLAERD